MKTTQIIKNTLEYGFAELTTNENEFLHIGQELGAPIKSRKNGEIVDTLKPTMPIDAKSHSLSKIFGLNTFPYHTDGAYFLRPPKYILFRYKEGVESPTPTTLLPLLYHLNKEETEYLSREYWSVSGRDLNFYSSIVNYDVSTNSFFLRYDVGCMRCTNKESLVDSLISSQINQGLHININWTPGKTLIVNNWRVLHNRPKVQIEELNIRTLQRLMING